MVGARELKIRLSGGLSPFEGRVEVLYRGIWGAVCDDYWEIEDGNVVCRMLGYNRAQSVSCCGRYGHSRSRRIWLDDVSCQGHEASLLVCKHGVMAAHDCNPLKETAGVVCRGDSISNVPRLRIRLSDGPNSREGRVEVLYRGEWGALCDDRWDKRDGNVVCRMLGFRDAISVSCCSKYGGIQSRRIWMDDVNCKGGERSLDECRRREWGANNCNARETAGVVCGEAVNNRAPLVQFRLVGGRRPNEGRVEVLFNGEWGAICDDRWRLKNGQVVCRELGYKRAASVSCCSKYGPSPSRRIWMDDVVCKGSERTLMTCEHRRIGQHNCEIDKETAGVVCEGAKTMTGTPTPSACPSGFEPSRAGDGGSCVDVNECNATIPQPCPYRCVNTVGSYKCVCPPAHEGDGRTCQRIHIPGPGEAHVRLTGGPTPKEGRVEVFYNGQWGSVCDDYWSLQDGHVVCRMLGYPRAGKVTCCSAHSHNRSRTMLMDDVKCNGNEKSLFDCRRSKWGEHNCDPEEEAGIECLDSKYVTPPPPPITRPPRIRFRLAGGPSSHEGRVEILYRGEWGAVCDDSWRIRNGHVICRTLGYPRAVSVSCCSKYGGSNSRRIWLDDVRCRGREISLMSCRNRFGSHNCNQEETAGVVCQSNVQTTVPTSSTTASSVVRVRLVNGLNTHEGRIEVLQYGEWGAVCDGDWDLTDGHVVCRALGYRQASDVSCCSKYGAIKSGRIWMMDVRCRGTEVSLESCAHQRARTSYVCSIVRLAGVVCENNGGMTTTISASTTVPVVQVRLVGGSSVDEGLVRVLYNGEWGYVCDDNWGFEETRVVCRALGYIVTVGSRASCCSRYRAIMFGRIWMDDVTCKGNESTLASCGHRGWGIHNCNHNELVGVMCYSHAVTTRPSLRITRPPRIRFRLAGGPSSHEGRVEILYRGEWGAVCDDSWRIRNGHVICRTLGYPRAVSVSCCSKYGGSNSRRMWLDDVRCQGRERSLLSCRHKELGSHNCNRGETAGVVCEGAEPTTTAMSTTSPTSIASTPTVTPILPVRLVGGSGKHEGRVEIQYKGQWGAVCDDFWDILDGHVVCRMLGYEGAQSVSCCSRYGDNAERLIWLDDVRCSGHEASLESCGHRNFGAHNCYPEREAAGVVCQNQSPTVSPGQGLLTSAHAPTRRVRLAGGSSLHEGRVEILYQGVWGAVCDDGWRLREGRVVCRMLGYSRAVSVSCCSKYGPSRSTKIWLDDVSCTGTEDTLTSCVHSDWGRHNCNSKKLAGVLCFLPVVVPTRAGCGIRPVLSSRFPPSGAANAEVVKPGDWPWQAIVLDRRLFPLCGGVLISRRWVLTTAQCFDRIRTAGKIFVRFGAYKLRSASPGWGQDRSWEQDILVSSIHKHPSYKRPVRWAHDIALLKLSRPVVFNSRVGPVCLTTHTSRFAPGTKCWTTGWGHLALPGSRTQKLRQVPVPIKSQSTCIIIYPQKFHESMICAGFNHGWVKSCIGDSGGPLVCGSQGRWDLIGLSSWGGTCGQWPAYYGFYSKVPYFANWIRSTLTS